MSIILLYLSCKAGICLPLWGEPMPDFEHCERVVKKLPPREDMKAMCVPVRRVRVTYESSIKERND
jgi:hypothetical protein